MAYTVKDVARLAGVTVRTLRYYDEIGLLHPAYVGDNGYRYYGHNELLRLQQIMLYREFDMALADIGDALDNPNFNPLETLTLHRRRLSDQRRRLERLLHTLDATIDKLKGAREMADEALFDGFDMEKQREYEKEIRARFGEDNAAVQESLRRTANFTKQDYAEAKERMAGLLKQMSDVFTTGATAGSRAMQDVIAQHYRYICTFYTPSKEMYRGLGQMYVDDERFRANYEKLSPGLAEFVRDAIALFADSELN